jgi:hypothetical protein
LKHGTIASARKLKLYELKLYELKLYELKLYELAAELKDWRKILEREL